MKLAIALRALLVLACAWIVGHFDPATTWWLPSCPLYAMTGFLCPLCGSLRAVHALLHGSPALAAHYNPLTTVAVPIATGAFLFDGATRERRSATARLTRLCLSTPVLVLVAAFALGRNLPVIWRFVP